MYFLLKLYFYILEICTLERVYYSFYGLMLSHVSVLLYYFVNIGQTAEHLRCFGQSVVQNYLFKKSVNIDPHP